MRDLAPEITRQRLLVEGYYTVEIDEEGIRTFLDQLPSRLGLRTYGTPTIFAPRGQGQQENQGFDAFVPLIDSGISLYVWQQQHFLSLVMFTCKSFDSALAVNTTRTFFKMTATENQEF